MTAPAIVDVRASTASATSALTTANACQAGDIAIFCATGTQTAIGTATPTCTQGGASFTAAGSAVDGSGTGRVRIWYRIIESGDLNGGIFGATYTSWTNNGTSRLALGVFRHANGWPSNPVLGTPVGHNTNAGSASASVGSISGMARPSVGFVVWGGNGQSTLQFTWDSDAAKDPYFDDGSGTDNNGPNDGSTHFGTGAAACQADFKAYDTAETVDLTASVGMNNTTHCALLAVFQVAGTPQSVSVGLATETNTASTLGKLKTRSFTYATETNTASTISHTKQRAVGLATETNTAGTILRGGLLVDVATETNTAGTLTASKSRAVGTAEETNTASTISRAARQVAVTTAEETNAANTIIAYRGTTITVGLSTPSGGAFATKILRAWAYTASATDVAELQIALYQGSTLVSASGWSFLTSTPTAYTVTAGTITDYTTLRAQITSRTTSSAVVRVSQVEFEVNNTLGTAEETNTAGTVTASKSRAVTTAEETNTAVACGSRKDLTVGLATETNTARTILPTIFRDWTYTTGRAVPARTAGPAVPARTARLP